MTTFSTSLKLELPGDGQQSGTWGQTTNKNLGILLEQAITGVQYITMVDANYTLTDLNGVSDEARNAVIIAEGTNSAIRDIIAPLVNKLYIIGNNTTGGFSIRIRAASGLSVTIPNGLVVAVYCDGTNFYGAINGAVDDFTVVGDLAASTLTVGQITGTTATFSGAISSVSPAFTGTPTAPTATAGTNTTQIATTAFVSGAVSAVNSVPSGGIIMWSGSIGSIPSGWYLCNGSNGTPDLRDRFIVGAGNTYSVSATGGSADAVVVSHTHSITDPGHNHSSPLKYAYNAGTSGDPGAEVALVGSGAVFEVYSHTTGISISSSGSSGTNANLPPYYALAYIMKS